jgi:hypothetical protein
MFWQLFVALPASALVMVMSAEVLFRSRLRHRARRVAGSWAVVSVALVLAQAVASPMYRCGGSASAGSEAMFADLHAKVQCTAASAATSKVLAPLASRNIGR